MVKPARIGDTVTLLMYASQDIQMGNELLFNYGCASDSISDK